MLMGEFFRRMQERVCTQSVVPARAGTCPRPTEECGNVGGGRLDLSLRDRRARYPQGVRCICNTPSLRRAAHRSWQSPAGGLCAVKGSCTGLPRRCAPRNDSGGEFVRSRWFLQQLTRTASSRLSLQPLIAPAAVGNIAFADSALGSFATIEFF